VRPVTCTARHDSVCSTARHDSVCRLEWIGSATAAALCTEALFETYGFDLPAKLKVGVAWRKVRARVP
jgi:hypothetical protein